MGIPHRGSDAETMYLIRERLAGMEREIPLLRQDIERLRVENANLRSFIDRKMDEQESYMDSKVQEMSLVLRTTPSTAVIDPKFWWLIVVIGFLVAITMIIVVLGVVRIYGNMPL